VTAAKPPISVVAYGLGPIGIRIATRVAGLRPRARLVAAVDIDPALLGKDLGGLLGTGELGLEVSSALDIAPSDVGEGPGVVLHCTGSHLVDVAPQLKGAVELGWNVISTCEELSFPSSADSEVASELDALARSRGVTVVGTGINPGFLMDTLPLVLTTVCTDVTAIEVRRVVNTEQRRKPLQQKVGVGMEVSEFERLAAEGRLGHVGLPQSLHMLAKRLGWEVLKYESELKPVLSAEPVETGLGPVPAGGVIGQAQWARADCSGDKSILLTLQMSCGAPDSDEILVTGSPSIHQRVDGGVNGDAGTEAVVSNLLPVVTDTPPGLLTMADLTRIAWFSGV